MGRGEWKLKVGGAILFRIKAAAVNIPCAPEQRCNCCFVYGGQLILSRHRVHQNAALAYVPASPAPGARKTIPLAYRGKSRFHTSSVSNIATLTRIAIEAQPIGY